MRNMAAASSSRGSPLPSNGSTNDSWATRGSRYSTRIPRCKIELEEVFGNTVTNSNAFDTLSDGTFAVCSGSTAVVNSIAPDQTIKQRSFRAPTKRFIEATPVVNSTPNSPSRVKGKQALRTSILPTGSGASDIKNIFSKTAVHRKPKGTSCLALSPNGLLLAIGETGYAPRILMFLLTSRTNIPVSIATEHDSGIQALCFSPDSKWLCSVGDIHDGYIHIWQVTSRNSLKLCASSKCTSFVHQAKWISVRSIVTAGVRHLKIWRPEFRDQATSPVRSTFTPRMRARQESPVTATPAFKSLSGRNVLLDELLDATFTSLCQVDDSTALVTTDSGNLSVFSVEPGTQRLTCVMEIGAPIRCATFDNEKNVILAATDMDIWISSPSGRKADTRWNFCRFVKGYHLTSRPLAIGFVTDYQMICIDDRRRASLYRLTADPEKYRVFDLQHETTYPTHPGSVNGSILRAGKSKPSLLTYDASGHLVTWGSSVKEYDISVLAQPSGSVHDADTNELRVMKQTVRTGTTICGDKYGCITVFDTNWTLCDREQAHTGETNDIAVIEVEDFETLIVTCGRDRVVQVFSMPESKLTLAQTLDQHNASVNKLEVVEQITTLLLSLSSDRTIVVHALSKMEQSQAFICIRTITVKSTPLSCALDTAGSGCLLVTTADKQLQTFELSSGSLESSARTTDEDDQIAIQHMQIRSTMIDAKPVILVIGVSNKDKALRVHNGLNGELMCKAGGHSEGITSLTILEEQTQANGSITMRIVTTSIEGTVMFWKLWCYNPWDLDIVDTKDPGTPQEARQSPLRKILSKTQLAGFATALNLGSWSALPSPTREHPPSRKSSPDRLRRRASLASLSRDSPKPSKKPAWREAPLPGTRGLPLITTKSSTLRSRKSNAEMGSLVAEPSITLSASEQLIGSLREFRTSLRRTFGSFDSQTLHEVKLELEMTLDVLASHEQTIDDSSHEQGTDDSSHEQATDDSKPGQDMVDSRQDGSYYSAVNDTQSESIAEE